MRVSDPKLHKQYGREVQSFDATVWEHERENMVLVGSYAKFAHNSATRQHLLDTGDRLLAEASPCDTIWRIGYRADHQDAQYPPESRGLNLLRNALQIVRQHLRDGAPLPAPRRYTSPPRSDSLTQGRYLFLR